MSRPQFCSGCGKRIEGACAACRRKTIDSLKARRAIPPGCPAIKGEASMGNTGHYEKFTSDILRRAIPVHRVEPDDDMDDDDM